MHIHKPPNMLFHSRINNLQQSGDRARGQDRDVPSPRFYSKNRPSPTKPNMQSSKRQAPTDSEMEEYIPGFSKLDTDKQLAKIKSAKSHFAAQIEKDGPACEQQRKAEAMMQILSAKEEEVRKGGWSFGLLESFLLGLFL